MSIPLSYVTIKISCSYSNKKLSKIRIIIYFYRNCKFNDLVILLKHMGVKLFSIHTITFFKYLVPFQATSTIHTVVQYRHNIICILFFSKISSIQ